MKSIEEQKEEKVYKIGELIIEQAKCLANAMNTDLSDIERGKYALRAILIQEVHIPMVEQTPLMKREYPKGGVTAVGEQGPEFVKHDSGYTITVPKPAPFKGKISLTPIEQIKNLLKNVKSKKP